MRREREIFRYFDRAGASAGGVFFFFQKMNFFDIHRDSLFELHHLIERVFVFDLDFSS